MAGEFSGPWRKQVAALARAKTRLVGRFPKYPSEWRPQTILSGVAHLPLSDSQAFEHLAGLIEANHPIQKIELRQPPGDVGYVMKFLIGEQVVYAKFQVKNVFLARSFHLDMPGQLE